MFKNIKTVKNTEVQSFFVGAFMDVRNILNNSLFINKPTQEINDKQVSKHDFNKQYLLEKIQTNFSMVLIDWLSRIP